MEKVTILIFMVVLSTAIWAEVGFEFQGMGRAGVLVNQEGNQATVMDDKSANRIGRLGNEPDIYFEARFVAVHNSENGVWSNWAVQLSPINNSGGSWGSLTSGHIDTMLGIRQVYGEIGGLPFAPNLLWWAGRRYHQRWNIYITDHFVRDYSGTGGGVYGLGAGALDVAYVTGNQDDDGNSSSFMQSGGLMSHNIVLNGHFGAIDVDLTGKFTKDHTASVSDPDHTYGTGTATFGFDGAINYKFNKFFGREGFA
jgi:maltoporin